MSTCETCLYELKWRLTEGKKSLSEQADKAFASTRTMITLQEVDQAITQGRRLKQKAQQAEREANAIDLIGIRRCRNCPY